jgi:hypothetical protein
MCWPTKRVFRCTHSMTGRIHYCEKAHHNIAMQSMGVCADLQPVTTVHDDRFCGLNACRLSDMQEAGWQCCLCKHLNIDRRDCPGPPDTLTVLCMHIMCLYCKYADDVLGYNDY